MFCFQLVVKDVLHQDLALFKDRHPGERVHRFVEKQLAFAHVDSDRSFEKTSCLEHKGLSTNFLILSVSLLRTSIMSTQLRRFSMALLKTELFMSL